MKKHNSKYIDLSKYKSDIKPLIENIVSDSGFNLYNLSFVTENQINYLRITISHDERSINLDDCEKVSRKLSSALDESNKIPFAYSLEVESPGISDLSENDNLFEVKGFGKVSIGEKNV